LLSFERRTVTTMIALFRGLNNGISFRMPMVDLRSQAENVGLHRVQSYWSTGNLVFESNDSPEAVAEDLAFAVFSCGFDANVCVRTRDELASIVDVNPFHESLGDRGNLRVHLFDHQPDEAVSAWLDTQDWAGSEVQLIGREVFVRLRSPFGRILSTLERIEREHGLSGVSRYWNTLLNLNLLCQDR